MTLLGGKRIEDANRIAKKRYVIRCFGADPWVLSIWRNRREWNRYRKRNVTCSRYCCSGPNHKNKGFNKRKYFELRNIY